MYAAHRASQSSKASSVVPIGGAPFVPPLRTMIRQDGGALVYSSEAEERLSSAESTPVRRRQSCSSTSEGSSGSGGGGEASASSSPVLESGQGDVWQAAVRYSSAMQTHTRKMWENERLNIERARLGLPGNEGGRRGSEASSTSTNNTGHKSEEHRGQRDSSLTKRNTISGGVDALFRGRKRHVKSTSVI